MATDFFKILLSLGLSKTETQVYLASLDIGPSPVQDIAKRARISRTAAYEAIEALQARKLFTAQTLGKKRLFHAESPNNALKQFQSAVETTMDRLQQFERALPDMKVIAHGDRPSVRFFEGQAAIYAIFNDLATVSPSTFCEVSNIDDIYNLLDLSVLKDAQKSLDPSKTRTRILHSGDLRSDKRTHVEFCRIPKDMQTFHGDIWIYADRVAFFTFVGKTIGVIIESQAFADTGRALFETAWLLSSLGGGEGK